MLWLRLGFLASVIATFLPADERASCDDSRNVNRIHFNAEYLTPNEEVEVEVVLFDGDQRRDVSQASIEWDNPKQKLKITEREDGAFTVTPVEYDGHDLDITLLTAHVLLGNEEFFLTSYPKIYRPWGVEQPPLPRKPQSTVSDIVVEDEDSTTGPACEEGYVTTAVWRYEWWPKNGSEWNDPSMGIWDCFIPLELVPTVISDTEIAFDLTIWFPAIVNGHQTKILRYNYQRSSCTSSELEYIGSSTTPEWCPCTNPFYTTRLHKFMSRMYKWDFAPLEQIMLHSYWDLDEGPEEINWIFQFSGRAPIMTCGSYPKSQDNDVPFSPMDMRSPCNV